MDTVKSMAGEQSGLSSSNSKASLGIGLGGALLSSVCCLLPALALAMGFGGTAALVQMGAYQPYLLAASFLFVIGSNLYLVQRRRSCCATAGQRRALYLQAMLSVAIFLLAYGVINYVLVPWLYDVALGAPSGMPGM